MQLPPIISERRRLTRNRVVSVDFPDNLDRVRKVVSRSNARITGKWPSLKSGRMAHYDSVHERNAFKLLDAWPQVRSWTEQPCTIRYLMDGEERRHIPDILVDFGNTHELWEVKIADEARKPENQSRTALMTAALPAFGYHYRLVIAEDLARTPRMGNIQHLLTWGRHPVALEERESLRQLFSRTGTLPWGLFQPGEEGFRYRNHVCRMILEGTLSIDMESSWKTSTPVVWN